MSIQRQQSLYRRYRQAFRYGIILGLTGLSFRAVSLRVADSHLFQWFTYTADRGIDTPEDAIDLEKLKITNGICPRSVSELEKRLEDETFCCLQKRRGSTEARIGIFKNAYLGTPLKSKGFKNRKTCIEWCIILTHYLWKIATMATQRRTEISKGLANTV